MIVWATKDKLIVVHGVFGLIVYVYDNSIVFHDLPNNAVGKPWFMKQWGNAR